MTQLRLGVILSTYMLKFLQKTRLYMLINVMLINKKTCNHRFRTCKILLKFDLSSALVCFRKTIATFCELISQCTNYWSIFLTRTEVYVQGRKMAALDHRSLHWERSNIIWRFFLSKFRPPPIIWRYSDVFS